MSKEELDVWAAIQLMARTPTFIELEERNEGEKTFPEEL
jgi:hypothetical protein